MRVNRSSLVFAFTVACVASLTLAACGADPNPPPNPDPAFLVVENASQYTLVELRFSPTLDYSEAANALELPLAEGETYRLWSASASLFVTVFREKFAGGDLVALTTQRAIGLTSGVGVRVKVFDQSFRTGDEPYVKPPVTTSTTSSLAASRGW